MGGYWGIFRVEKCPCRSFDPTTEDLSTSMSTLKDPHPSRNLRRGTYI